MIINMSKKLVNSLILIFFLPSFILVTLKTSSLASGIVIASFFLLLYNYKILLNNNYSINYTTLFLFIASFLLCTSAYLYVVQDFSKPFYSMVILIMFFSSYIFAKYLSKLSFVSIIRSFEVFLFLLIFFGWLKLFYIPDCCGYSLAPKATFPFPEESHFALVFGMFAVAYSFVGKSKLVIVIFVNALLFSLLYPSLTLLIFSILILLGMLLRLKPFIFKFTIFVLFPLFLTLSFSLISNIDYFSSRLSFSESSNLTTLVFLQGWELAYLNFIKTNGLGLGFQMLGSSETITGVFTDSIGMFISGGSLNIEDGGFLAAKLIAEFGILGVSIVVFYIYWIIKIIFKTNYLHNVSNITDAEREKLLMYGIIFGFLIEMLLRGYGYFSPGFFLMITSVMYLKNKRINKRMNK